MAKSNSAFMKPMKISSELAAVVGSGPMPRSEVVKALWAYIKKHNLQDPQNKRNINADETLKKVFGGRGTVNMFEMTKLVSAHLSQFLATTFQKNTEDFTCTHCGYAVRGNGYTNHCPECLWSKHVDIYPGDRAVDCGGLMSPVDYRVVAGGHDILHRCVVCDHQKWNKLDKGDKLEVLIEIVK